MCVVAAAPDFLGGLDTQHALAQEEDLWVAVMARPCISIFAARWSSMQRRAHSFTGRFALRLPPDPDVARRAAIICQQQLGVWCRAKDRWGCVLQGWAARS